MTTENRMKYQLITHILREKPVGKRIEIRGWLKTKRDSGRMSFLDINDGSRLTGLQVIAEKKLMNYDVIRSLTTGSCLRVRGKLVPSPAKGQEVELIADDIEIYGTAPAETYPLQKKRHSFEFLREIAHLRPRTNSLGSMSRIRSHLTYAAHSFFQERDFFQIHTPLITTSDCEGAGEMFSVTSLDLANLPLKNNEVDFSRDFFGCPASLTVSGQLEAEAYALSLGRVYTFGPTFRAENSHTNRHLAEFWMLEPEMAFFDLKDDMDLAEELIQHLISHALTHCREDLDLFARFIDKTLYSRLESVLENEFARIDYTEAVDQLSRSKQKFTFPVTWGVDLQSEHERYLTENIYKRPVIVINYPKTIKPFYMRVNDDGKTVAAMDILLDGIGEIIGGSQREERLDVLKSRMKETGVSPEDYQWYLDLRRYGTAPHSGFGMGFERMVQFITGMANIRDVIPFPRTPGGG